MDFWQFGIYVVILSGASSLVIMTILLIVRKMSQTRSPHARLRDRAAIAEWAHVPPARNVATPPPPATLDTVEQNKEPEDNPVQLGPTGEDAGPDIMAETSLTSPLSAPGAIEPAIISGTSPLATPETSDALMRGMADTTSEETDNETEEEYDTGENNNDDSDPLRIFQMEENQENPISELSSSLPDIDVSSLLRESKEVLRILGVEADEY